MAGKSKIYRSGLPDAAQMSTGVTTPGPGKKRGAAKPDGAAQKPQTKK